MPNGTINPETNYVEQLASEKDKSWSKISAAHDDALEVVELLNSELKKFTSGDVDLIVFGSLARREWTSGSDVDWTMLVDGQVDANHRVIAREITDAMAELKYKGTKLNEPGSEGVFGNMAFSHEIVHHIGGQADSNKNTTQRILMLLEATALRSEDNDDDGPFQRVIKQILDRYLHNDSNFHAADGKNSRIPRFLLNDIVRYWRTLCVDFGYKEWEQAGKKWALRNIKLRTSRKILFVAGLLTVFSCYKNEDLDLDCDTAECLLNLQSHLLNFVHSSPLNIITWTLVQLGLEDECCELLDCYEEYLLKIDDKTLREKLEKLEPKDVYEDACFLECREISHRLQGVFNKICFEEESPLRDFTKEYGVF